MAGKPLSKTSGKKLPKITVITPVLNACATLPQALESVAEQLYPGLEHIVVDGGSTDGTVELLKKTKGIRWISGPDRGLSHALNKGLAMASGDLVGWLNADDFYLPGSLFAVGQAYGDHPEAMWVTGRCRIVDGQGVEIRKAVTAYKNFLLARYSFPLYLTQNFISAPATFVARRAFDRLGLFDERYRISMDYDFYLRLAEQFPPLILPEELSCFRMIEGTLSMSGFELQFKEHAEQARIHGKKHPGAVVVNQLASKSIIGTYKAMRYLRNR